MSVTRYSETIAKIEGEVKSAVKEACAEEFGLELEVVEDRTAIPAEKILSRWALAFNVSTDPVSLGVCPATLAGLCRGVTATIRSEIQTNHRLLPEYLCVDVTPAEDSTRGDPDETYLATFWMAWPAA